MDAFLFELVALLTVAGVGAVVYDRVVLALEARDRRRAGTGTGRGVRPGGE